MARLLVVHHSPTAPIQSITDAVLAGACTEEIPDIEVVAKAALEATADDVLAADGYLLGTPANFGYISGALKHFFDTTYLATREVTAGRPFSYWIRGAHDTTGADTALRSITTGFGWKLAAEPLVFTGEVDGSYVERAFELGATLAVTVAELD